jgi:hypothetical protein
MLQTSAQPYLRRPFARLNPKPRAIKNQEVSRIAKHRRNKKYALTAGPHISTTPAKGHLRKEGLTHPGPLQKHWIKIKNPAHPAYSRVRDFHRSFRSPRSS